MLVDGEGPPLTGARVEDSSCQMFDLQANDYMQDLLGEMQVKNEPMDEDGGKQFDHSDVATVCDGGPATPADRQRELSPSPARSDRTPVINNGKRGSPATGSTRALFLFHQKSTPALFDDLLAKWLPRRPLLSFEQQRKKRNACSESSIMPSATHRNR